MDSKLESLATALEQRFAAKQEIFRDQLTLFLTPDRIIEAARALRDEFGFTFLSDESAVDYFPQELPRFHVVYQLRTMQAPYLLLTLRVPIEGGEPHMPTLEKVFPNANWFERELWDMFGIRFDDHSDLRRILMPFDWEGHPLRKDYPLGYEEVEFSFNFNEVEARKPHPKD